MPWSAPLVGPGLAVDLSRPVDLSWRVRFDEASGKAFGIPPARAVPVELGRFVGDVRRGGSCNCETVTLTPHGDGTHTEGVGHLLAQRIAVIDTPIAPFMPALLVSVTPQQLDRVDDDVSGNHEPADRVIDQLSLEDAIDAALARVPREARAAAPLALIVRTQDARARYSDNPAYFTVDAAGLVRARGFTHVLVDLPSLDRADDGGLLGAHRAFFDLAAHATTSADRSRTVTELCAIPQALSDGLYALSLQLAPMETDAVPSRPVLFPLVASPLRFRGAQGEAQR